MPPRRPGPPRPLEVGDIVTCYNHRLGEWTAGQITDVKHEWKQVAVLELEWSGPEPSSTEALGEVRPVHRPRDAGVSDPGKCEHRYVEWVLPRSYKVIGSLPLLTPERTSTGSVGWRLGEALWSLRLWNAGVRDFPEDPATVNVKGLEFRNLLGKTPDSSILSLMVFDGGDVDVAKVADLFPKLQELYVYGSLDTLLNPRAIARMASLRKLNLYDVFGMTAADVVTPAELPHLEHIWLQSIPQEYSAAMSKIWRPEAVNGTFLQIFEARRPNWIAENRDNPLRDWDGREDLTQSQVKKSFAHYKSTRKAVLECLATAPDLSTAKRGLAEIAVQFADAFNTLMERGMLIETQEREELLEALAYIAGEASTEYDFPREEVEQALIHAANQTREW